MLDWVILLILVLSIVRSAFKGFVREVLGLITVLAGALLASWSY
ncbi:MAG: CvpA family protein, partial [Acidobacteria bacterium]|nr:CvpA family protein [Acidobacteriota bacterium]